MATTKNVPYMLHGAEENLHWKDGEFAENAVGSASINIVTINMLRHIAQNNGVVTDGSLRMIQELVDFLPQNSINTFQNEFRKLVAEAIPSNYFHNPFLPEEEAAQQPVQRILFPSMPSLSCHRTTESRFPGNGKHVKYS
ncbi:hypothetical protein GGI42DRAFT_355670 [Trichoderma sp. SZMC 28013]